MAGGKQKGSWHPLTVWRIQPAKGAGPQVGSLPLHTTPRSLGRVGSSAVHSGSCPSHVSRKVTSAIFQIVQDQACLSDVGCRPGVREWGRKGHSPKDRSSTPNAPPSSATEERDWHGRKAESKESKDQQLGAPVVRREPYPRMASTL